MPANQDAFNNMVMVEISPDEMEAYVILFPSPDGKYPRVDDVYEALREEGVVAGILDDKIREAVDQCCHEQSILVARGQLPINGRDATIEYKVNLEKRAGKPKELQDGRVDFRDLGIVENIREGTLLAVKTPATQGLDGFTVKGTKLPAQPGRDIPLHPGKNVKLAEGGLQLVAAASGALHVDLDRRLHVYPVFEVKEGVGPASGNVDFVGNLVIRGGIAADYKVRADGNIEVYGHVEGAEVQAGGNIIIHLGIRGGNRAHIEAGGDVVCTFIETAEVKARGNVIVAEAIMHSQVSAGKRIEVRGKGLIVGGTLRASDEIEAKVIGATLGTATELEVGIDPVKREELIQVTRALKELEGTLDKVNKTLALFKEWERNFGGMLPPDKKDNFLKLLRQQNILNGQKQQFKARKEQLEQELLQSKRGKVKVGRLVYPGVRVTIGWSSMDVEDELQRCILGLDQEGNIAILPY